MLKSTDMFDYAILFTLLKGLNDVAYSVRYKVQCSISDIYVVNNNCHINMFTLLRITTYVV